MKDFKSILCFLFLSLITTSVFASLPTLGNQLTKGTLPQNGEKYYICAYAKQSDGSFLTHYLHDNNGTLATGTFLNEYNDNYVWTCILNSDSTYSFTNNSGNCLADNNYRFCIGTTCAKYLLKDDAISDGISIYNAATYNGGKYMVTKFDGTAFDRNSSKINNGSWCSDYVFVKYTEKETEEKAAMYRIKEVNQNLYLTITGYNGSGETRPYGTVPLLEKVENNNDQIWYLETTSTDQVYNLRSKSGYYIVHGNWNVNAYNSGSFTKALVQFVSNGEDTYNIKNINADKWWKCEYISNTWHPFCDASKEIAATWVLEPVENSEGFVPGVNITYNFTYNDVIKYTQSSIVSAGEAFPDITVSFPYGITATKPIGIVEKDTTYNIELKISELPFNLSNINGYFNEEVSWYKLTIRGNKYWQYDIANNYNIASTNISNNATCYYAFTGNPFDGYKIYNYAAGADKVLHCTSNDERQMQMTDQSSNSGTEWILEKNSTGDFLLRKKDTQHVYIHDFGGNGYIGVWDSSIANTDNGSYITFESTDINDLCTITYNFTYNNEVKLTKNLQVKIGDEYPDISGFLPYGATATKPTGNVSGNATVNIATAMTLPFESAKSYNEITKWYYLKLHSASPKYIEYIPAESYIEWADENINKNAEQAHLWAFIGNAFDGYKMVNNAAGSNNALYFDGVNTAQMSSYENAQPLYPYPSTDTGNEHYFCLRNTNGNFLNAQYNKVTSWHQNDQGSTFIAISSDLLTVIDAEITLLQDSFQYNGSMLYPKWQFTDSRYNDLQEGTDYTVTYTNNTTPGKGTVIVKGIGGYSFETRKEFTIEKGELKNIFQYSYIIPEGDFLIGENINSPSVSITVYGAGNGEFFYKRSNDTEYTTTMPTEEGVYDIYLSISEGYYYKAIEKKHVGSFSICSLNATEWELLQTLHAELQTMNWNNPWDITQGKTAVSSFHGLDVENGSVVGIDLSSQGLTGLFPTTLLSFPNITSINLSSNSLEGDIATALYAIILQNPEITKNITSVNISNNAYSGNIGVFASCLPALTSLYASHNKFDSAYPTISQDVTDLDISSQNISKVLELKLTNDAMLDFASQIPAILLYDHVNQTYKTDLPLIITTANPENFDLNTTSEWFITLNYSASTSDIEINNVSNNNVYRGKSGDIIYAIYENNNSVADGSNFKIAFSFDEGDANFINGVDVTDLQTTILYMFNQYNNNPFNFTAADIYTDEIVNVQDIVCIVDIILTHSAISNSSIKRTAQNYQNDNDASVYIKDGKVFLNSKIPVAALNITSAGNIEWNMQQYGMTQAEGNGNVVAYSLSGATLPTGETIIGTCIDGTTLHNVALADERASLIRSSLGYNGATTAVEYTICNDENIEFYNAAGVRQEKLSRGINLIKVNGKVRKVLNNK